MMVRAIGALLVVLTCWPAFGSTSELEKHLNDLFKDKQLTLRHADANKNIDFDAQGTPKAPAKPGFWFENTQLLCTRVVVKEKKITFEGRRVFLLFDPATMDFAQVTTDREVKVTVNERGSATLASEFLPVLPSIFLMKDETLAALVPDYWKVCWHGKMKDRQCVQRQYNITEPPKPDKVGGSVTPPIAIYDPQPEYPIAARKLNITGVSVLWVVVAPDGTATQITVQRPAGNGLDDAAAETVKKWKFEPAKKNGEPVAVQVNVEVNFRLH